MTPLICAAIEGHVEAVRVLLEAGANRDAMFDGETALKLVRSEIKFPLYSKNESDKQRYREVAELLEETKLIRAVSDATTSSEVEQFARNAKKPGYRKLYKLLEESCGKGKRWKPVPDHGIAASDVVRFTLQRCQDVSVVNVLQQQARQAQCHLVLEEPWLEGENAQFVLFPTTDKFTVMTVVGTEGANYSVSTDDIIRWLKELDKDNPFDLRYCSHDMVGGEFRSAVKRAKKSLSRWSTSAPERWVTSLRRMQNLHRRSGKRRDFWCGGGSKMS